MKNLKLSKTSWLILAAGVFIVILAGLGMTRSQQLQSQSTTAESLKVATARLDRLNTTDLKNQAASLQQQLTLDQADLKDATSRLDKSVVSADVAEEFYNIASQSGVFVTSFTSTPVSSSSLQGIPVSEVSISGQVTGTLEQVVGFIINVNSSFRTGYVKAATIQIGASGNSSLQADVDATASVQIIIYSYNQQG